LLEAMDRDDSPWVIRSHASCLRAALSTPEPTYHLSTQEQKAIGRALIRSTRRVSPSPEPTDNQISCKGILDDLTPEPSREVTQEEEVRAGYVTWFDQRCALGVRPQMGSWLAWKTAHAAGYEAGFAAGVVHDCPRLCQTFCNEYQTQKRVWELESAITQEPKS
jgi:hypothetical protein